LGIPLEHDEGKYAYAGHLILQDMPPYELLARQLANSRRFITTTGPITLRRRSEITGDLRTTS
jgi:hypothetical protein